MNEEEPLSHQRNSYEIPFSAREWESQFSKNNQSVVFNTIVCHESCHHAWMVHDRRTCIVKLGKEEARGRLAKLMAISIIRMISGCTFRRNHFISTKSFRFDISFRVLEVTIWNSLLL
jgi:uncharacterized protein YbcI